jgi:toxin FitB
MNFLVDTDVISELRKRNRANAHVRAWSLTVEPANLYLSVISLLEIEQGILRLERRKRPESATLRAWFSGLLLPAFEDRILSIDAAIALRCAALHVPKSRPGADAFIAATALVHGLTIATRNTKDFTPMGVRTVDPFQPGS